MNRFAPCNLGAAAACRRWNASRRFLMSISISRRSSFAMCWHRHSALQNACSPLYTKTSMVASRFLWQQKQRFKNSSPTNTLPFSWHLLDAPVAAAGTLTADLLRTVGSCCFLGDGCMMRRSPTSSPADEAAIGVEVEAPTPSSRWKRLGALGIMLALCFSLQVSASLGACMSVYVLLGETEIEKILQES